METLRVTITLILGMALPFAVQRWHRLRLTDEQRAGAWNAASWGAALYAFGPLSMIGWCWVTRPARDPWRRESIFVRVLRSASVLLKGLLAALLISGALLGVDALLLRVEGDPGKLEEQTALFADTARIWLVLGVGILVMEALLRIVAGGAQPRTPTP